MVVAFAVGVSPGVGFCSFAAVIGASFHRTGNVGNHITAVVVYSRMCRFGSCRDAGYGAAARIRHREVVTFDSVGVDPFLPVTFAVFESEGVGLGTLAAVIGTAFNRVFRSQVVVAVVFHSRSGRYGRQIDTSHSAAAWFGCDGERLTFDGVGICPGLPVAFAVFKPECVSLCSFATVIGTAFNCIFRSQVVVAVVFHSGSGGHGCQIDTSHSAATWCGFDGERLTLDSVCVDPVVVVSFAVGVSPSVSLGTFAAVIGATFHRTGNVGNHITAVVVYSRMCRFGSCRDAGYGAAARIRHREVVTFDSVGVDPFLPVTFAVFESEGVGLGTLAAVIGTAFNRVFRSQVVVAVVFHSRSSRHGCQIDTSHSAAAWFC